MITQRSHSPKIPEPSTIRKSYPTRILAIYDSAPLPLEPWTIALTIVHFGSGRAQLWDQNDHELRAHRNVWGADRNLFPFEIQTGRAKQ